MLMEVCHQPLAQKWGYPERVRSTRWEGRSPLNCSAKIHLEGGWEGASYQIFDRKYIFIHGGFFIAMVSFRGGYLEEDLLES